MSTAVLTTKNSDAWKRILLAGQNPPEFRNFTSVTLPGMVEFALGDLCLTGGSTLRSDDEDLAPNVSLIRSLFVKTWHDNTVECQSNDIHGTRILEFFRLRTPNDLLGHHFQLFQERFVRSIKSNGFDTSYAYGLAKALDEMADNVIQHSHLASEEATGIIGYHTESGYMAFTVADIGRGILASLRTNPQWHHLESSQQSLTAIVKNGASCRSGQGKGEGFKQLFRSLIDRNSLVRLRSANAALDMVGVNDQREGKITTVPDFRGVQISICCSLGGIAKEKSIKSLATITEMSY